MAKKAASSMANPVLLKPVNKADGIIQVIIETPKGSRNKFAFDVEQNIFTVKAVLPAGTELLPLRFRIPAQDPRPGWRPHRRAAPHG